MNNINNFTNIVTDNTTWGDTRTAIWKATLGLTYDRNWNFSYDYTSRVTKNSLKNSLEDICYELSVDH